MLNSKSKHRIRLVSPSPLSRDIREFLIDRQARGLSPRTVDYYREKLQLLRCHLESGGISEIEDLTPRIMRTFLVSLTPTHNPGGVTQSFAPFEPFPVGGRQRLASTTGQIPLQE